MGYTTDFEGAFKLDPPLTHKQWLELRHLADFDTDKRGTLKGAPDSYCQWTPNDDGDALAWDGNEKFYYYREWLQWLIDNKLTPWGIEITGEVKWQGEEVGDTGVLSVRDREVHAEKLCRAGEEVPGDEIAGLRVDKRFFERYRVVRR